MKRNLGQLIGDSFKEYKSNFWSFTLIIFLLSFIPGLVLIVFQELSVNDLIKFTENPSLDRLLPLLYSYFIPIIAIYFVLMILNVFMQSTLFYLSIYKKNKMGIKEAFIGGKKYFFKILGYMILIFLIFLVPLFVIIALIFFAAINKSMGFIIFTLIISIILLLLIILLSFLMVYLVYTIFIIVFYNKGIIESIKLSKRIIKGKYWKTFGYLIVMGLIAFGVSIVVGIIPAIASFIIGIIKLSGNFDSLIIIQIVIEVIFQFISNIIIIPITLLYVKNMFLDSKEEIKK